MTAPDRQRQCPRPLSIKPAPANRSWLTVALAERTYDIVIGRGAIDSARRAHQGAAAGRQDRHRHRRDRRQASSRHGRSNSGGKRHRQFAPLWSRPAKARRITPPSKPSARRSSPPVSSATIWSSRSAAASSAISPASLRRACGAVSISCRCRPRCWRRSIPRSAARPASIRARARIWSALFISRFW